ncbi:contractile injection system protein, VgrG/Pvc8 family [Shinella sp.]|uniref:contractile injection system protein, VgrG/Pvc8 family n=1 Tax=Shinella sp. TaxID=1870904 RepID=UPI0025903148|nr:contractile injection system protein, VgrG/Pvc8 family [Shinella sp.]MCW5712752.1 hypothetical protein [Shinella sp.]
MRGYTPQIFCSINGRNVSGLMQPRLIRATVTDGTGIEGDGITVELDNAGDVLDRPQKGDSLVFGGGYRETGGPRRLGSYRIEDAEKAGPKRRLTVIARAGGIGEKAKEKKNRAWDGKTIEEIVSQIAGEMNLVPAVDPDLASIRIPYRAQLNESDMHMLTQIGQRLGAMPNTKDGHLVFARKGKGMSVSGVALPIVEIGPDDLHGEDAFRLRGCARARYGSIRAYWHDPATASRKKVEEAGDGPVYEIPELFQDEAEARAAVKGQRNNSDREEEKLSLTVIGKETRQAEARMVVSGIDRDGDGEWSIDSITHNFIGSAIYTNNIEAVRKEKKT